jgi:ATP-dependent Clp protease ATP-binding subunit ClpC
MEEREEKPRELSSRMRGRPSGTPIIDRFGRDLTELASEGKLDLVIGREEEIERMAQILSRRKKNNPVLIGEAGVGKTAVVEGLAIKIKQNEVPSTLMNKRLVALDLTALVAGTKYRGDFEERLTMLLSELQENKDIIVFIDELHTIVGAGSGQGSMDASNILKPALARGEIQCIGATTLDEYRQHIEKDKALERRFQKVSVDEPSAEQTFQIITKSKGFYENFHNVSYTEEALSLAVKLADRYITDRFFPDKAFDILDEAGSRVAIHKVKIPDEMIVLKKKIEISRQKINEYVGKSEFERAAEFRDAEKELREQLEKETKKWKSSLSKSKVYVTEEDISSVVSKMTGIPLNKIAEEESHRLLNMEEEMKKEIIGQDEAIEKVCRAIRRARVGLKDPKRPIGSFLFLGSTGVGKTELTKALARMMFDSEDSIIRVDMSEYMEKHAVSKLVGAPPGYVGYGEGGQLTEKVRRKPFSIILFDEVEKAHPEVFNILLQVLDDGHLTDGNGRKVDFKNTIIIMTSNVGVRDVKVGGRIGFSENPVDTHYQTMKMTIEDSMKMLFTPEFLNRIDEHIVFKQLEKAELHKIIDIQVQSLMKRLGDMNITLNMTEKAKDFLVEMGYDVKYGARPLKRTLQKYVEDALAEEILRGNIKQGTNVIADFDKTSGSLKVMELVKKSKRTKKTETKE